MKQAHRQDIDGLRTIAVLSVVLYHFDFPFITGGYVGVDVFFVISGYLITSNIYNQIENGTFSFISFYERRFRRLFPALAAVLVFTSIIGFLLLSPIDLLDLGRNIVATTLFGANILSYLTLDYFAAPANFKPLLHTWSLAVEEQFYFIFPIIAVAFLRVNKSFYAVAIISLFFVSLVWSTIETNQTATFYLPHLRAWELLMGSLIALPYLKASKYQWINQLFGLAGLSLILYSVLAYTHETKFPGLNALPPTVGTALLILSGKNGTNTFIKKLLSHKTAVSIGLISYSLYLWHWPIIVYAKYVFIVEIPFILKCMMVVFTFWISYLSTKYIETPFRNKSIANSQSKMLRLTLYSTIFFAVVGSLMYGYKGVPSRFNVTTSPTEIAQMEQWKGWGNCVSLTAQGSQTIKESCIIGKNNVIPTFMLWGDSHARSLGTGMDVVANQFELAGLVLTKTACAPLSGIDRVNSNDCYDFNERIFEYLKQSPEIETVYLSARWALAANGTRYKHEAGPSVVLASINDNKAASYHNNTDYFTVGLESTLERLTALDKKVYIVSSIPEIGYNVPHVTHMSELLKRDANSLIAPSLNDYYVRNRVVNTALNSVTKNRYVGIVDITGNLCDNEKCNVVKDNNMIYRDDNHLSFYGSILVSNEFSCSMNSNAIVSLDCGNK